MRALKKILIYGFFLSILFALGGMVASYVYQDKIVNIFINEANSYLLTPIKVEKIRFSVLEKFPHMAIVIEDVYVRESLSDSKDPLGVANKIYLTFSIYNLLRGRYVVDQISLQDAEVHLKVTRQGKLNYVIVKQAEGTANQDFGFDIDKISLKNVAVTYHNQRKEERIDLVAKKSKAKLSQKGKVLSINLDGEILSRQIEVDNNSYFKDKDLEVKTAFTYEMEKQMLSFSPSDVLVNQARFIVDGHYLIAKENEIDLRVSGDKANVQTLFSLLPDKVYQRFKKYKSRGALYFQGRVNGKLGRNVSPAIQIDFGCTDATFIYPENNKKIQQVYLTGSFHTPSVNDLGKARLSIQNIEAILDNRPIAGKLVLENFKNYYIDCTIDASLDVNSILGFFPVRQIARASGIIDVDINFKGRVDDFRGNSRLNRVENSGEINVENLNFRLATNKLDFKNFNGNLLFKNNDLAINNFRASAGNSGFVLDGYFKNFLGQLLSKKQPLIIQANLQSPMIDLDELLSSEIDKGRNESAGLVKYYFDITPRLNLDFNCDVDKLKFRRFRGKNIKGGLWVKNQKATARNLSFNAAGGTVTLNGTVDAKPKNDLLISTRTKFDHIEVDSVFYIFENFNQSFLEDRHLKGQFYSTVNTQLAFNKNLKWYPNSLFAKVESSIKNGELNKFEPMKSVAKYVRRESLDHLRFSEIKNHIRIENQVIYVPPMEISSNVRTIKVEGTHTFGQMINYDLKIPIRNPDKRDKDEAFGAIEEDGKGNTNLFLTIVGSTTDYRVVYNTQAVKQKIRQDIRKEGQELKEIFRNKGKKKETIELNEDEYIDFDSLEADGESHSPLK